LHRDRERRWRRVTAPTAAGAPVAITGLGALSVAGVLGALGVGALSCAILVANNLRDIPGDEQVGKRTLAVAWGDAKTRRLYQTLVLVAFAAVPLAAIGSWWVLLGLAAAPLAWRPVRAVRSGATGSELVPVLSATGLLQLGYGALLTAGLMLSA
ncbi:MAG: UbiA family prenyltransferase, partial [Ornithinimicrobium sp.]